MTDIIIHLSSGQGPEECRWVIGQLAGIYSREARGAGCEVEANPAKYFTITMGDFQPAALQRDIALMRGFKNVSSVCGNFDYSQPALHSNAIIKAHDARRLEYGKCLVRYKGDLTYVGKAYSIRAANIWVRATRRFTCALYKRPNCIPDGPFNAIANIATDANVALVERLDKQVGDQHAFATKEIEKCNQWVRALNERIRVWNASR